MAKSGKAIPDGFRTITPHIVVKGAGPAIEFYKKAFGAEEIRRIAGPGGNVMHAEMRIGDSIVMLNDEFPDYGALGPKTVGGTSTTLHIYVTDADAFMDRAVKAGAEVAMPLMDMFWGDRYGKLKDPYGHHWSVATHKEDLTDEEVAERMKKEWK